MTDKPAESAVERYETERRRNDYGNTCGAAMQVHRLADAAINELLAEVDRLTWMLERIRDSEYDRMSDADALADLAARYEAQSDD